MICLGESEYYKYNNPDEETMNELKTSTLNETSRMQPVEQYHNKGENSEVSEKNSGLEKGTIANQKQALNSVKGKLQSNIFWQNTSLIISFFPGIEKRASKVRFNLPEEKSDQKYGIVSEKQENNKSTNNKLKAQKEINSSQNANELDKRTTAFRNRNNNKQSSFSNCDYSLNKNNSTINANLNSKNNNFNLINNSKSEFFFVIYIFFAFISYKLLISLLFFSVHVFLLLEFLLFD